MRRAMFEITGGGGHHRLKLAGLLLIPLLLSVLTLACQEKEEAETPVGASPTAQVAETGETPKASPTAKPTKTPKATATPKVTATPTEEPRAGTAQQVGDARVTYNSWREDPGGQFLKPAEGSKWIVVDLTVENTGDDEYAMSTILQMQMRDAEGRTYDIAIGPDLRGSLDVVIPVADKVTGEVAFEVPAAASGLKFIFKQSFGTKQAMWSLE